jgi:hypothetical protein
MVKPSDFILNTDYLSIAQVGKDTYTFTMSGGTLAPWAYVERNFDFTTDPQDGAIDNILIKKDSDPYLNCSYMRLQPTSTSDGLITGQISVYRTSATNIRAQVLLENQSYYSPGVSLSYPSMAFTVKVASFLPPNVF